MHQRTRRAFLEGVGTSALTLPLCSMHSIASSSQREVPGTRTLKDRVGVTHVDGNYHLTDENFLNEGAKQIRDLGSRVIKVWFHHVAGDDPHNKYSYNSDWPGSFDSMLEVAQSTYFRALFQRDFRTYILVAYAFVDGGHPDGNKHYFVEGLSDAQLQQEEQGFFELTKHLLESYRGTGKEFVLQHWQGDWAIIPWEDTDAISANNIQSDDIEPTQTAIDGMIEWLNARQRGVERARSEIESDVTVLHAAEVNMVLRAIRGQKRVINTVIPETNVDLVSHNSYREMWRAFRRWNPNDAPARFQSVLDYINENAPTPSTYAKAVLPDSSKNVFIGEYGLPFEVVGDKEGTRIAELATQASLEWGVPYTLYWQLYDSSDGGGYWLIRPDGRKTSVWDYFESIIDQNSLPTLPTYTELVLEFNTSVEEHTVNSAVTEENSRALTFRCSELELLDSAGESISHYSIGRLKNEPVLTEGVSHTATSEQRSSRWFVAGSDHEPQTVIYIEKSQFDTATELRIRGVPIDDNIEADVRVDGRVIDHVDFQRGAGWADYFIQLQTITSTLESSTAATSTSTSTTPTARTSTPATTTARGRTAPAVPGFGVLTGLAGIGLGLRRYLSSKKQ